MVVDDIMELLLFVVVVVLPLLTVTMRLSLKPIVDAVIQLSEGLSRSMEPRIAQGDASELERMQEDLAELRQKVAQLEAADSFYRGLIESPSTPETTTPAP